jgi:ABC-type phosphate transport system permease subunit
MNKLCIFGTSAILSYVGWILAAPLGLGWAFFISSICALVGVYVGWKIARRFE